MKSFLAAILSLFVPGLGQLYKGHFVQAIIWFLVVGAAYGLLYWFVFALVPIPAYHLHSAGVLHGQRIRPPGTES